MKGEKEKGEAYLAYQKFILAGGNPNAKGAPKPPKGIVGRILRGGTHKRGKKGGK